MDNTGQDGLNVKLHIDCNPDEKGNNSYCDVKINETDVWTVSDKDKNV